MCVVQDIETQIVNKLRGQFVAGHDGRIVQRIGDFEIARYRVSLGEIAENVQLLAISGEDGPSSGMVKRKFSSGIVACN